MGLKEERELIEKGLEDRKKEKFMYSRKERGKRKETTTIKNTGMTDEKNKYSS
jgi:hypothetical protein